VTVGYEWDDIDRRLIWRDPPWWRRWWLRLLYGNGRAS